MRMIAGIAATFALFASASCASTTRTANGTSALQVRPAPPGEVSAAASRPRPPVAANIGAQAQPDTRPSVVVIPFTNGSLHDTRTYDALSVGVADLLAVEFAQNRGIRVVEREALQKVLDEIGLSSTDRIDQTTALRIGKIVLAHHVVRGTFVVNPKGRTITIGGFALQTETTVLEHSAKVEGKPDDVGRLIAELGTKLNSGMKDLPPMPVRAPPGGSTNGRFEAMILYSRGLVEEDRGNVAGAVALYKQALEKYPDDARARVRLEKLRG